MIPHVNGTLEVRIAFICRDLRKPDIPVLALEASGARQQVKLKENVWLMQSVFVFSKGQISLSLVESGWRK